MISMLWHTWIKVKTHLSSIYLTIERMLFVKRLGPYSVLLFKLIVDALKIYMWMSSTKNGVRNQRENIT